MTEEAELFRRLFLHFKNSRDGTRLGRDKRGQPIPILMWDGGVGEDGRTYKPVWERVTNKLLGQCIDIEAFLEEVIANHDISSPGMVVADKYISEYINKLSKDDTPLLEWDVQQRKLVTDVRLYLKLGYSLELATARALENNDISPLVRYCFGRMNDLPQLVSGLELAARKQYLSRRLAYERLCPERIPEHFRQWQHM